MACSISRWPGSAETCENTQRSSTAGCRCAATSTAELVMKPSTTITRFSSAACSTAPVSVAISKPPSAASASSGSVAWACRSSTWPSTWILCCRPAASSPAPGPTTCSMGRPARRASSSEAGDVLPMPISPSRMALPGRLATCSRPLRMAVRHCSGVMAGCSSASAVPAPTRRSTSPGCSGSGSITPQSTTCTFSPCWRASTLTVASPDRMPCIISVVTEDGQAETPCATRPWSPAHSSTVGS